MALTRKYLMAMGIELEKIDQIIESHGETVSALKADIEDARNETAKAKEQAEQYKQEAAKVPALEKQIEDIKSAQPTEDWQVKYDEQVKATEALQAQFDQYKAEVAEKDANAEKLSLYKSLLRDIGLDEKRVEKAAKLKDLSELAVEDGKLAGYDELKESEAEDWKDFIPQVSTRGAKVPTPPASEPTDDQADPSIKAALQARHERLYGKSEE